MADYYDLLEKLVAGLPPGDPSRRHAVYDRARAALSEQLRTLEPPLSQGEIDREGRSLEDAIQRVEAGRGEAGPAPPVPDAAPMPRAERQPAAASLARAVPEPARPPPPAAIRRGGKPPRSRAVALALVLLAAPVAGLAWLWRDRPSPEPAEPAPATQEEAAPAPSPDVKYAERVAGGPPAARPAAPPAAPATPAPAAGTSPPSGAVASQPPAQAAPQPEPSRPAPAPAQETLVVAQRALIFQENPTDPGSPTLSSGRAVWRLDQANGGQGQPLETVIRGRVDLPDAALTLSLLIRRNLDPALPASHTMELTFTSPRAGDPARIVRDVALPMMRPEEGIRGVAVVGLPVPVKDNVFLIGLSDLKADIDKNLELLLRRNWMELPIRFASGQKAALLFDKGLSGERVFLDAFRQWGQVPPDQANP